MRKIVLAEEPLCRLCLAKGRVTASGIADHIVPLSEGGTGDRSNYQALGYPRSRYPNGCDCHDIKTAEEAARAKGAKTPRPRRTIGPDGWPE